MITGDGGARPSSGAAAPQAGVLGQRPLQQQEPQQLHLVPVPESLPVDVIGVYNEYSIGSANQPPIKWVFCSMTSLSLYAVSITAPC